MLQATAMLLGLSSITADVVNGFKKVGNSEMEWIEKVWFKQGSALATMDITGGSQGQAHKDHQKHWAARGETPLLGSSCLPSCSCFYSPHNDTPTLAC